MPIVVARIVHRLDVGEAHTEHDEHPEQRRHEDGHGASGGKLDVTLRRILALGR
jgi:hypothetical protein